MNQNYNDCLTRLLKDEGGYSDDPNDSGGPTNYGITLADYRRYIKSTGTALDVKNMKVADAKQIYKSKYWDACNCDTLPSGVDYTVFDYAVNSGTSRPIKDLAKFSNISGVALIDAINDERVAFLKSISSGKNAKFLKGWLARVDRVRTYSKQLSQPNNIAAPVAAVATVGAGSYLTHFWHGYEAIILGGSIAAAILIAVIVHAYLNEGKS